VVEIAPDGVGTPAPPRELVLRGEPTPPLALLKDVWAAFPLVLMLARRDFFVRYRRTAFGLVWSVALPVIQALVLAVVLHRVANFKVTHFPLFLITGMVGWTYFVTTLSAGSTAIVANSTMSSRIYFPRAVLPLATCMSNVFGLVIGVVIAVAIAVGQGIEPGLHTLWLVPAIVMLLLVSIGLTLVLSALHVYFRDVQFFVQAALFAWFYVTPVFYPISYVHGLLRDVTLVNPVSGSIEMLHAAVVGTDTGLFPAAVSGCVWTFVLLLIGLSLHCRFDRRFADLL
jgi:lipopolysaccharide transport system permease protein